MSWYSRRLTHTSRLTPKEQDRSDYTGRETDTRGDEEVGELLPTAQDCNVSNFLSLIQSIRENRATYTRVKLLADQRANRISVRSHIASSYPKGVDESKPNGSAVQVYAIPPFSRQTIQTHLSGDHVLASDGLDRDGRRGDSGRSRHDEQYRYESSLGCQEMSPSDVESV